MTLCPLYQPRLVCAAALQRRDLLKKLRAALGPLAGVARACLTRLCRARRIVSALGSHALTSTLLGSSLALLVPFLALPPVVLVGVVRVRVALESRARSLSFGFFRAFFFVLGSVASNLSLWECFFFFRPGSDGIARSEFEIHDFKPPPKEIKNEKETYQK